MKLFIGILIGVVAAVGVLTIVGLGFSEEVALGVEHNKVVVASTNDEWTPSGITVRSGDLVVVMASGNIKVGEWTGVVSAYGAASGTGQLYAKTGPGAEFPVGASAAFYASESGALKLRVKDDVYTDNEGSFVVTALAVAPGNLPAPEVVRAP